MTAISNKYILVFGSHNQAAYLYNILRRKGYKVELISTPCKISNGCTQSIRFGQEYLEIIKDEVRKNNIFMRGIYRMVKNGSKTSYFLEK